MIKEIEFCDACKKNPLKNDNGDDYECELCKMKLCGNCYATIENPTSLKITRVVCCFGCKQLIHEAYTKIYNKLQPEFSKKLKAEYNSAIEVLREGLNKPKRKNENGNKGNKN